MGSIEAELVLEHRRRMRAIAKAILNLLLDEELILVNIGDDGCWVEMRQVDDQMHLRIDVDDALLLFVLADMHVKSHVVILDELEIEGEGFV